MNIDWKTSIINGLLWGVVLLLATNYTWWAGFNSGADAVLCLQEHQQVGADKAMKAKSCQNIKGKSPPADIWGMKGK
jgi:hypothetical protein